MNHEKLRCYQELLDAAKSVPALIDTLPRGYHDLVDQLQRALTSAILNLSEGNARTSKKERARFFDISLASLAESAAALDIMRAFRLISLERCDALKSKFRIAYAMIVRLKKPRQ